ncbi:MAG: helix-turn-helix domain-containing protein [Streptosporangiales bacterium]|nr:helix-turn-helix domain-containing protein [Streptosporangiales bacterium]
MLRIHFTGKDLGRVRFTDGPEPMWEVLLGLHALNERGGGLVFDQWRRHVRRRLCAPARWLLALAPPRGYSPDFLTPGPGLRGGLEEDLDAVLATPRRRIGADLARLAQRHPLPGPAAELAGGDRTALRTLGAAVRAFHAAALAPFWDRIQAEVHTDLTDRGGVLMHGGAEPALAGLPGARWRPPTLEVPYPVERDLHLGGRGLRLVPAFFCRVRPVTLADPELPPALVYPIEHDLAWFAPEPPSRSPGTLAALLGRSRAAVLTAIAARPATTTQVARRIGVSMASASQHATVLRNAGLISTCRRGSRVVHTVTPAGAALAGCTAGSAAEQ